MIRSDADKLAYNTCVRQSRIRIIYKVCAVSWAILSQPINGWLAAFQRCNETFFYNAYHYKKTD